MNESRLGELLHGDEERDAIHVAIAPVIAVETLAPGVDVGFVKPGDFETVGHSPANPVGVIDPFLDRAVKKGERCWMLLFPGTITSLKHKWTHPAFETNNEDIEWITELATSIGMTYCSFMEAAKAFEDDGKITHRGSDERYSDISSFTWEEFWERYSRVTGEDPWLGRDDKKWPFFTCSC